jgi:hypothetical protein
MPNEKKPIQEGTSMPVMGGPGPSMGVPGTGAGPSAGGVPSSGSPEPGPSESGKRKKKNMKENTGIDEATLAGDSLHPAAKSIKDSKALDDSKVKMMMNMFHAIASNDKHDLTDWYKKAMERFHKNADVGVGNEAEHNTNSINGHLGKGPHTRMPMPTIDVKEDLDVIFSGTDLSENFKAKTSVLFESAVHARVIFETARLEEEFVEVLQEEISHFTNTLTDKLDNYLDYVVENWMRENQVAMENTLRNEIAGEFMNGLKGLFSETFYMDIPDDKVDVTNALADKIAILETRLEDVISENSILKDALINEARQDVIEECSTGLTVAQAEKFSTLAEGIDFEGDFDDYAQKLMIIKESHFNFENKSPKLNILEESFEGDDGSNHTTYYDPSVRNYVDAISRVMKPYVKSGQI